MITPGDIIDFLFRLVPLTISAAALFATIWMAKRTAARSAHDKLETRIGAVETALAAEERANAEGVNDLKTRLGRLEQTVEHLPSGDTVHRLEVNVEGIRGDIKAMAEGFKGLANTTRRIDEFLLASAGRGNGK